MASTLVDTATVETLVQSGLPTPALELIIDAADADIIRFVGPHDGERTVRVIGDASTIFLPSPAASIREVREWWDWETEAGARLVSEYSLLGDGRYLTRTDVRYWDRNVKVTYTPYAENARRAQVLIDLVKWELARSGLTSEQIGSYRSTQANIGERSMILGRLRHSYAGAGRMS